MYDPELYSISNNFQKTDTRRVFSEFGSLLKWKPKETILDIGCGNGDVIAEIMEPLMPKDYLKLVGMDISPSMVEFARDKYGRKNPKLDFVVADICAKLEHFEPYFGKFDHVMSFFCFHWLPNQRQAFKNIYHMLKPGGACFLSNMEYSPLWDVYKTIRKTTKWGKYMHNLESRLPKNWDLPNPEDRVRKWLQEDNYNYYKVHVRNCSFGYDDEESFRNFLITINPCLSDVPQDEIEDYIDCIADTFIERGNVINGRYEFTYKMLLIYAVKSSNYQKK